MRQLALVLTLLLGGCATFIGDHPFSSLPKSSRGPAARFAPGSALYTELSIPTQAYATETVRTPTGDVPAKRVVLFAIVRYPRGPWEGCRITVTHNGDRRWLFPTTADHSWVLDAPFGIGQHTLTIEVVQGGNAVYARDVNFTIYP